MFVVRICHALAQAGVDYAVAGGHAVALHGAVRGTVDVDLIIHLRKRDFQKAEAVLKLAGLKPRLPVTAAEVFDFREEYITRRNMLAWSFTNHENPIEVVDILICEDLAKHKVIELPIAGRRLRVLARDDLIRMKKAAGRPQDLEDVAALQKLHKKK